MLAATRALRFSARTWNASRLATSLPRLTTPSPRYQSRWSFVEAAPADPILGVTEKYKADTSPDKLNLGVGAYRDDSGKPVVLPSVATASRTIVDEAMNNEYAPIAGSANFSRLATRLIYGSDAAVLEEGRVAAIQALSGTGCLRLFGAFLQRFQPMDVFVPRPTWGNHHNIFRDAGLDVHEYRYYNPKTKGLDLGGMLEDLGKAPDGSCILLHACAHNPTGVDPKPHEWKVISQTCKTKGHYVLFDSAYQGFASGDPEADAASMRAFVEDGHDIAVAQSFSKNFGLYGHRTGCLSMIVSSPEERVRVESQLKALARALWSNPAIHGARIVELVLDSDELNAQWHEDVKGMADRIIRMREELAAKLRELGSKHNWDHITDQIGMFCYSGLTPEQVQRLTDEFHIYLTKNGRISMAGVTSDRLDYLAGAIHEVTKDD